MLKHHPIERMFKKVAPDTEVLWNAVIERWQVYQRVPGKILTLNGQSSSLSLLWTIQQANGDYREPGEVDVKKMVTTAHHSKQLWDGNVDWIADSAEKYEIEREETLSSEAEAMVHTLATDMADAKFSSRILL